MLLKAHVNSDFKCLVGLRHCHRARPGGIRRRHLNKRQDEAKTTSKRMYILIRMAQRPLDGQTKRRGRRMALQWRPDLAPHGGRTHARAHEQRIYVYRSDPHRLFDRHTGREVTTRPGSIQSFKRSRTTNPTSLDRSWTSRPAGQLITMPAPIRRPGGLQTGPMPYFQRLTWGGIGLHSFSRLSRLAWLHTVHATWRTASSRSRPSEHECGSARPPAPRAVPVY